MKVKLHIKHSKDEIWVNTENTWYLYGNSAGTTIVFSENHSIMVKETLEEINAQLPGGLHEH